MVYVRVQYVPTVRLPSVWVNLNTIDKGPRGTGVALQWPLASPLGIKGLSVHSAGRQAVCLVLCLACGYICVILRLY